MSRSADELDILEQIVAARNEVSNASASVSSIQPSDQSRDMALRVVKVVTDGGSAGSSSTNCSYTYTVKDLRGNTLATAKTPYRPRYEKTAYIVAPENSYGLALIDNGSLTLLVCFQEIEQTDACA